MKSLSITRIHYEFTVFSGIHYESTFFFANLLWIQFLWIHFLFRASTMISFLFRELTIYIANILGIHCLFHELTLNSLSLSRIYLKFSIISREFNMNSVFVPRIHYQFRDWNTMNSPSVACIHYFNQIEFIVFTCFTPI